LSPDIPELGFELISQQASTVYACASGHT